VSGAFRAIVTGANGRVGLAIAERLAARGAELLITTRRREQELRAPLARLQEAAAGAGSGASSVHAAHLDLADAESIRAFATTHGAAPLDVLVLNAGSYARSSAPPSLERGDPCTASARGIAARREAIEHFEVNAASALALCTALAPALAASSRPGGGAIVVLGDMHAMGRPVRGFTPYLMSKAALSQMVDSLAVELAPHIRVNAVHPGVVAWPPGTSDEVRRAYEARIPLARSGAPEDAAGAVAWLALDAPYLTGVHLRVDGGRWLR